MAALEAVLALRTHAPPGTSIELIAPTPEFTLRALSVAEPFDRQRPREIDLAEFCRSQSAELRMDALAEVWGEQQRVLLASGEDVPYDALLLAFGARQRESLPGSRLFRGPQDVDEFSAMLEDLRRGSLRHLAFAVAPSVRWSLPLYELALMTAHRLREDHRDYVEVTFVTHEDAPLEAFVVETAEHISGLLRAQGIKLATGLATIGFDGEALLCERGRRFAVHEVVSLPELFVPEVPGVPQGRRGFIGCNAEMQVDGLRSVWVSGDASWLPIKQGGLAAQQAEVAAAAIAAAAGADLSPAPFKPVLRAALLTGEEPVFLRSDLDDVAGAAHSASPLWWPPIKVAGPRLAPFLARAWTGGEGEPAREIEDLNLERTWEDEDDHREALRLALAYADLDARHDELEDALRWLDVAERLNVTLPAEYVERRETWRAETTTRQSTGGLR